MINKTLSLEYFKELPDGSAIVTIEMDAETKEFFIGEGFLAVLKRAVANSESLVPPEHRPTTAAPPKKKPKSRNVKS
jgi:hypothetical protein